MLVLLQDLEDAGRRRMAGLARGAGRGGNPDAIAIDMDLLVRDRHDDQQRTTGRALRKPVELAILEVFCIFVDQRGQTRSGSEPEPHGSDGAAGKLVKATACDDHRGPQYDFVRFGLLQIFAKRCIRAGTLSGSMASEVSQLRKATNRASCARLFR